MDSNILGEWLGKSRSDPNTKGAVGQKMTQKGGDDHENQEGENPGGCHSAK